MEKSPGVIWFSRLKKSNMDCRPISSVTAGGEKQSYERSENRKHS
jgi:hypothetical protein